MPCIGFGVPCQSGIFPGVLLCKRSCGICEWIAWRIRCIRRTRRHRNACPNCCPRTPDRAPPECDLKDQLSDQKWPHKNSNFGNLSRIAKKSKSVAFDLGENRPNIYNVKMVYVICSDYFNGSAWLPKSHRKSSCQSDKKRRKLRYLM